MKNSIEFVVFGEYGLFTDPLTKIGGEKASYPVPTYQSLKGIIESVYWKPSLLWVVDEIRVMNPINMESKGVRPLDYTGGNTLAFYSYLKNPCYQVRAHFEFNPYRPDLKADWNEGKHYNIAKRSLEAGGRRDIFLGTRECQAYVEPCTFGEGEGFYDNYEGEIHFGTMIHGINYPDETGNSTMEVRMWQPKMKEGIIEFIKPQECKIVKTIKKMNQKEFTLSNIQSVDELYMQLLEGGGLDELDERFI